MRFVKAIVVAAVTLLCSEAFGPIAHAQVAAQAQGASHWTIDEAVFGVEVNNRALTFSATRLPNGEITGSFEYIQVVEGVSYRFTGDVTCFNVYDGNRAKVGGVIRVSTDPSIPAGMYGWFQAIDNGEGAGTADQSTIMGFGDETANEAFCASPNLPRRLFNVVGNISVR